VIVAGLALMASGPPGALPTPTSFTVLKLAGTTGVEVWRRDIPGSSNGAIDIAVGRDSNVVAAGALAPAGRTERAFGAVKLDGGDGHELWRFVVVGTASGTRLSDDPNAPDDGATAVALDGAGNAVVAGAVTNVTTGLDLLVVKRDTAGNELARCGIATDEADFARSVTADRDGRIVVGGATSGSFERSAFTVATFP
jgi:hypothetical protein